MDDSPPSPTGPAAKTEKFIGPETFTDFSIVCQDVVFRVHKIILVMGSSFFKKALSPGFKEAATDTMNLDEEDPNLLQIALEYLYHRCDQARFSSVQSEDCLMQCAQLYAVADRFDIQQLKSLVKDDFETLLKTHFSCDDFPDVIHEVYATTPESDRGLRDPIVAVAKSNFNEVSHNEGFFNMMELNGCFGRDLVKVSADLLSCAKANRYECSNCDTRFAQVMRGPKHTVYRCHGCGVGQTMTQWAKHTWS